ncbi:ribose transport protein RbsD [Ilyobacter polytropus DSM 2926]|uniref:D-ribose pyranase n=2 Tax=Ilyobacter TaxID=167639 RepID=E3HAW5_ILYPC|nr:D-ribose pyranase [Ilyobacter polytropus]ADO82116.1 ribose transport protein RbsD [Ilyobacter polytropus DSM 2926]
MKKMRLLNSEISYEVAKLGHTDHICIGDAGLPIPAGVKRIDLALERNIPTFMGTLDVILDEMQVEEAIIASEMKELSPKLYTELLDLLNKKCQGIKIEEIPHSQLKKTSRESKAVIRTGECTPYANIILKSGVAF